MDEVKEEGGTICDAPPTFPAINEILRPKVGRQEDFMFKK